MSDITYCIHTAIELCLFYKIILNNIAIMRTKQFLLILLFLSVGTYAQEVNYYFEQYTNSYENLEDRISLTGGKIWDDPDFKIPVDIKFDLLGTPITELNFGSGWGADLYNGDRYDGDLSCGLSPISSSDLADRAYNFDLDNEDEPGGLSPISYQVIGKERNQILKIEWNNVGFLEDLSRNYYMNFQLWLYEKSHMIEVHYGPSYVPDNFFTSEYSLCGFFTLDTTTKTGSGYVLEEDKGNYVFGFKHLDSDWENFDDYLLDDLDFFKSVPENGTVFRFYPEYAVGMNEIESVIKMHPNPTTDVLYFENNEQLPIQYKIVSLEGRILKTGTSSEQKIQVDVSNLNTGMYFLRGTKNGVHFTKTISKI